MHRKVDPGTICDSAVRSRVSRGHSHPSLSLCRSPFTHPTLHWYCRGLSLPRHVTRAPAGGCRGSKTLLIQLQYAQPSPAWISSSSSRKKPSLIPCSSLSLLLFFKNHILSHFNLPMQVYLSIYYSLFFLYILFFFLACKKRFPGCNCSCLDDTRQLQCWFDYQRAWQ